MKNPALKPVMGYNDNYILMHKRTVLTNLLGMSLLSEIICDHCNYTEDFVLGNVTLQAVDAIAHFTDHEVNKQVEKMISEAWRNSDNPTQLFTVVESTVSSPQTNPPQEDPNKFLIHKEDFAVMAISLNVAVGKLSMLSRKDEKRIMEFISSIANNRVDHLSKKQIDALASNYQENTGKGQKFSVVNFDIPPDEAA